MSRFTDELNKVSQSMTQPMGFRLGGTKQQAPRLLLVGSLSDANFEGLIERMAGADAGLLHTTDIKTGAENLKKAVKAVPDMPWGVRLLAENEKRNINPLIEAGCDFVIFPPATTPLATLDNPDVGKILEAESSFSEGMLRTVNELPVDAVLLASAQNGKHVLTWHHLILFQRLANLSTKPLLVWTPPDITVNELQALLEAGVKSIIIETGVGKAAGKLKEIRQRMGKLTPPSPRKGAKMGAVVPRISEEAEPPVVEEEGEEGEEE